MNVVAALIKKDNKYLIAKRASGDACNLGKWEFPGGKVEPNESEIDAIIREIKEELNIDIRVIKYLTSSVYESSSHTVQIKLYERKHKKGVIQLKDHSEYRYVTKDELLKYDLCKADIALAAYIKGTIK